MTLPFQGPDELLEKRLRDVAQAAWARLSKDRRGGWLLSFGSLLSTNPNDLSFRVRVVRGADGVHLLPSVIVAPWNRAKAARLVAVRLGQVAAAIAGSSTSSAEALREPFAGWGAGPVQLSASFAWVCAGVLLAFLATTLAAALAFYPLLNQSVDEIDAQARRAAAAGALPLPTLAELERNGPGFVLGASFIAAFPLAFLAALLHGAALAASEASLRTSRLPQASFVFLAGLLTLAFFPFTPLLALPCALLVPAAAHLAYAAVWGRRREYPRSAPRPRPGVVAVALLLALGALAFVAPVAAVGDALTFRLSLFRDRALLGHPFGKAVATAYYRSTLYAAWPMKEFMKRGQRTAVAKDPEAVAALQALHFTILPDGTAADVVVSKDAVESRGLREPLRSPADLKAALASLSRESFRGGMLQEASGLGWMSMYFAGPPAFLLLVIGLCCPFVSIMYRAMKPRTATIALGICLGSTLLLMWVGESALGPLGEALGRLRKDPTPDRLRQGLAHASVVVRHEAAVLAYQHPHPSLADALLPCVDDPDLRVRLWACGAIGKTGDARALPRLVARLDDQELFVRYRAAEGLGHLKRKEAVEPLTRFLKNGSWYEGVYALEALRRIP